MRTSIETGADMTRNFASTGVIIGDNSVMIVDAQATPRLANKVFEKIRTVTDEPIKL